MLRIGELRKQDYKKAMEYATAGMHLSRYTDNPLILKLYARYFLFEELNRATQVLAAYKGDMLMGVLLVEMYGEPKKYIRWGQTVYTKLFAAVQNLYAAGVSAYDDANREMLEAYKTRYKPEGEMIFLTANPEHEGKGVGSALLAELERREPGREVFLYSDDWCTWQFYEHRGFCRMGEKHIVMDLPAGQVPIDCYLYRKKLGKGE